LQTNKDRWHKIYPQASVACQQPIPRWGES